MLDIDHLTKPLIPARALRAFAVGALLAAGVFLLAAAGCGSVEAIPEVDSGAGSAGGRIGGGQGGAGSSSGAAGARSGGGGLGGASGATGEATGGAGGRDAGVDAWCIPEAGVRYCAPGSGPCPPGLPFATCPAGTVQAGDGGTCPIGDRLIAGFSICIPSDAGT